MKIGIIGAPGSGKTEFAEGLAKEFDLTVIDKCAEVWSERTKLTIGFTGGYAHTLGISLDRIYKETEVKDNYVSCGTILDGIMYLSMMSLANPNEIDFARAKAYIEVMSMMYFDFWSYDVTFLLRTNQDPPEQEDTADYMQAKYEYDKSLTYDEEMPIALESFKNLNVISYPGNLSNEERIEKAIEEINSVFDK